MNKIWTRMKFSETPKAHAVFDHAADDQDIFDGIGDKVEDPIEKRHQTQAQFDHMLMRTAGGGKGILKCQATYEWMYSDPSVNKRVQDVHVAASRGQQVADNPLKRSSTSPQSGRKRTRKKLPKVTERDRLTKMVAAKVEEVDDTSEALLENANVDIP